MNTIHIDYMDIYKPLLEQKFITKFSSKTLAEHLLLLNDLIHRQ